jgi:hypothetical protein
VYSDAGIEAYRTSPLIALYLGAAAVGLSSFWKSSDAWDSESMRIEDSSRELKRFGSWASKRPGLFCGSMPGPFEIYNNEYDHMCYFAAQGFWVLCF